MQIFIKKANTTFAVDFPALPVNSQERVIAYGLTQLLSDACAPVKLEGLSGDTLAKAQAVCVERAQERLDNLVNGILAKAREVGSGDPVEREFTRLFLIAIRKDAEHIKFVSTHGGKPTSDECVAEARRRLDIAKANTKHPLFAIAKKNVDALADLGDIEL